MCTVDVGVLLHCLLTVLNRCLGALGVGNVCLPCHLHLHPAVGQAGSKAWCITSLPAAYLMYWGRRERGKLDNGCIWSVIAIWPFCLT